MNESKNRQWILETRPTGNLTGKEFRWHEAPIPNLPDGQVLVRNLWLSFDPTQRGWMSRDSYMPMVPLGEVMRAFGVKSENCWIFWCGLQPLKNFDRDPFGPRILGRALS